MAFLVFYITNPDEETARSIANNLVAKRLAACANIFPINSIYRWEGNIQDESEWVILAKTRSELERVLEAEVQAWHPYDVPCILRYEVRANAGYEQWIRDNTREGPAS